MKSVQLIRRHHIEQVLHLRHVTVEVACHVDVQTSVREPRPVLDRQRRQLAVWKRQVDERLDSVEDRGGCLSYHGDQLVVGVDSQQVRVCGHGGEVALAESQLDTASGCRTQTGYNRQPQ